MRITILLLLLSLNAVSQRQIDNSSLLNRGEILAARAAPGANTDITSIRLDQAGLVVKGGNSNALTIKVNETLTNERTLNFVVNDANRTLTIPADASVSGTNTGDNATNTQYSSDYRLANFIAGTNYLAPNGSAAALTSFPTLNQNTTGTAGGLSADIAESRVTNLVSDLALKAPLASPTFTGTVVLPSTSSIGTVSNTEISYLDNVTSGIQTQLDAKQASSTNTGGWTTLRVSGSNATTTGQVLVDVTGLLTGTLTNATLYEVEAVLYVTTSAVATGTQYAIAAGGTGGASEVFAILTGTTTTNATTAVTQAASATQIGTFLITSSASGVIIIKGYVLTRGSGTATISIQHLKVTSGTSTVKIGSVLRYRLAS